MAGEASGHHHHRHHHYNDHHDHHDHTCRRRRRRCRRSLLVSSTRRLSQGQIQIAARRLRFCIGRCPDVTVRESGFACAKLLEAWRAWGVFTVTVCGDSGENPRHRIELLRDEKRMAGEAAGLFLRPTLCCLSGIHLEAREANESRDRLYAAVHFNTMTSLLPDDLNNCWICRKCSCHISLTRISDMPRYDAKTVSELHKAMKKWQQSHDSVQATLHYMRGLHLDENERIILTLVPDGDLALSGLLGELHHLFVAQPFTDYHVSLTDPGEIHWFKYEPSTTLACPAAASSSESSSPSGTFLAPSVSSANLSESGSGTTPTPSNQSRAFSARSADPRIRELESKARVLEVFCESQWRCWCKPRTWRPLTALMPPWEFGAL